MEQQIFTIDGRCCLSSPWASCYSVYFVCMPSNWCYLFHAPIQQFKRSHSRKQPLGTTTIPSILPSSIAPHVQPQFGVLRKTVYRDLVVLMWSLRILVAYTNLSNHIKFIGPESWWSRPLCFLWPHSATGLLPHWRVAQPAARASWELPMQLVVGFVPSLLLGCFLLAFECLEQEFTSFFQCTAAETTGSCDLPFLWFQLYIEWVLPIANLLTKTLGWF